MNISSEHTFESAIVESLVQNGNYIQGNAPDYSPELGMFKYEVIIEHFRQIVCKIGGKAKAMVVTGSARRVLSVELPPRCRAIALHQYADTK